VNLEPVAVVGAGTIGGLVAGHLARVVDVTVLVRRDEHADALNSRGLRISGKSDFTVEVRATTDPAQVSKCGLVILTPKATQLDAAVAPLSDVPQHTVFMTMQNGMGVEEVVLRHGAWPIVSAVTFMSGTRHSDEHVEYELDTATWMGPFHSTHTDLATVETIGDMFQRAGLKAEVLPDLRPAQWSKLIFNSAVNGVAAITDLGHTPLYARRERSSDLGYLVADLMNEGKAVAKAAGVDLFEDPWEMNTEAVSHGQTDSEEYAHVPSMLADIRADRRTEVDFIIGSLVREGDRTGVDVPLSRALYRLVKARDRSYDDRIGTS
jgi:2-dehydropantoate 2-reductase